MNKQLVSCLLAVVLGASTTLALADSHEGGEGEGNEHQGMKADTNGDGKISYEEFKAKHEMHMQERFKKMDTNGDGYLDQSEKEARKHMRKGRRGEKGGRHERRGRGDGERGRPDNSTE